MNKNFHNNLKTYLNIIGMSQASLSRKTGIGTNVISGIYNGRIIPYNGWKQRIVECLNLKVSDIFPEQEKD